MVADLLQKLAAAAAGDNRPRAGYFCTYTPVEILAAAGCCPVRLEPRPEAGDGANGPLSANVCSFVRACLATALEGNAGDLGALVVAASCTGMMHLYSAWLESGSAVPAYLLDVPRKTGENATAFFATQLRLLARGLGLPEGSQGEDALWKAIILYGKVYRTLQKFFGPSVNIAARERRALLRLALSHADDRLPDVLWPKSGGSCRTPAGPSVLVTGCMVPDAVVSLVEEFGVRVAVDESCSGLRSLLFSGETMDSWGDDPFLALARRYLSRAPCPRMSLESRLAHVVSLATGYRVAGVIYFAMKFCDFALHEFPPLRSAFEARRIPVIMLEGEYLLAATGQLRTRIEAFLEAVSTRGE
ncbi:MAG: 2-hydroxyacyl-CoA dehydratase subunit D [Desulfotomaculales bacterium]